MFCQGCQYDLHGQVVPRCPECGLPFDFDDPSTFLDERFRRARAARSFLSQAGLSALRVLLVLLGIASYCAIPSMTHCGGYFTARFPERNLRELVKEWQRQCGKSIIDCKFDKAIARDNLPLRFSETADRAQLRAKHSFRYKLSDTAALFVGPGLCCALLGCTYSNRARKWLLLLGVTALVASGATCAYNEELASIRYRGSYAYLDDYDFLEPPFANVADGWPADQTLIAIERHTPQHGWKVGATVDGTVVHRQLAELEDHLACPPPPRS